MVGEGGGGQGCVVNVCRQCPIFRKQKLGAMDVL
ncbi:unnamed protein product, partial [Brugia pahangi]|uniref:Uncharacterized protein n=1 Tax=Brugia pahangi TaxID=6280 RepID=A0A0N4TC18_BRUPA